MTQEAAARKDTQRLQRAIVDGLEDVKAHDIAVFNTEHLSPLFERVIVASGTSNRQTKALAASVRDAVREAGFPKPRTEGEENGEWIIVDCGAAVAHIMQPAIREYYHLEEIWGDKPVRVKFGAPKPMQPVADKPPAKKAAGKAAAGKKGTGKSATSKQATAWAAPSKTAGKAAGNAPAKKTPAKTAGKATAKTNARPASGKSAGGKTASAKTATAKTTAKKAPAKKAPRKTGG